MLWVYTTFPSDQNLALSTAKTLVQERLAACVNVGGPLTSFYEWEGKMQEEEEIPLVIKTAKEKFSALQKRLLELHPYTCPCIVALPAEEAYKPYLEWVLTQCSKPLISL